MTQADAIAQIKALSQNTLTDDDVNGLNGCTVGQLISILQGYIDLNAALKSKTVWDKIQAVLAQVPEWAKLAANIVAAIGTVFAAI
jgi:hypothetical protein